MKRIVFLIIASLLVIGLVLPGCTETGGEFEKWIDIAITGPMTFDQGKQCWQGAVSARDDINDAGGVDIGGVMHGVRLTKVDTNEISDITGTDGVNALTAVIDDMDFVLDGFQETASAAYREVALDRGIIFVNSGVSTVPPYMDVLNDYEHYKYYFQGNVFNDYFLDQQFSGIFSLVMAYAFGVAEALNVTFEPKIAIVAEDETWVEPSVQGMEDFLKPLDWWVGTWRPSMTAGSGEVLTMMADIAPYDPHFIYFIVSGPVGVSISKNVRQGVPGAIVVGSNTEGQRREFAELTTYDPNEDPGCAYEIIGDFFTPGVALTSKTVDWFDDYVERWGNYPTYIAGSYDSLSYLMHDVETAVAALNATSIDDVVSAENIDVLIQIREHSTYEGIGAKYGYFPMPIELEEPVVNPLYGINTTYVLSEEVVNELYPHLSEYGMAYNASYWTVPPHVPHCVVGGSDWAAGIGNQWQEVSPGKWDKVAIWPAPLFDPGDYGTTEEYYAAMMGYNWLNQWGNYNFSYEGSGELILPDWWIAHHFGG